MQLIKKCFSTMMVFMVPHEMQEPMIFPPPALVYSFGLYLTSIHRRGSQHLQFIPNVSPCNVHYPIRTFFSGGSSEVPCTPCSHYGLLRSSNSCKLLLLMPRFLIYQAFSMQHTAFSQIQRVQNMLTQYDTGRKLEKSKFLINS